MVYRVVQRKLYTIPEGSTVVILEDSPRLGLSVGDTAIVVDGPSGKALLVDDDVIEASGNLLVRLADEETIQQQEAPELYQSQQEAPEEPYQEQLDPQVSPPGLGASRVRGALGAAGRGLGRAAKATYKEARPILKGTGRFAGRAALGTIRAAEAVVGFRVALAYVTPGSTVQALEDDPRSDIVAGDIGVVQSSSRGGKLIHFPDTGENIVGSPNLPVMILESRQTRGRAPGSTPRIPEAIQRSYSPPPSYPSQRPQSPYTSQRPRTTPSTGRTYLTKSELVELLAPSAYERPARVPIQYERPRGVPDAPSSFRPRVRPQIIKPILDDVSVNIPSIEIEF